MNCLLTAGLLLLLACSAHAGGNPNVRAYIDFDPPNYVHAINPAPYTTVEAYLCLDNVEEGVTSISFMMQRPDEACPAAFVGASWQNFFPSGIIPMNPWPSGVTVPSTECMAFDPLVVGVVTTFYLGGSSCIQLLDHPDYARWVVDCGEPYGEVDLYCVLSHVSVGGAECPEGDCGPVPVEGSTWGTIKALYR